MQVLLLTVCYTYLTLRCPKWYTFFLYPFFEMPGVIDRLAVKLCVGTYKRDETGVVYYKIICMKFLVLPLNRTTTNGARKICVLFCWE